MSVMGEWRSTSKMGSSHKAEYHSAIKRSEVPPWLMFLGDETVGPSTEGSRVRFPVKGRTWVAGSIHSPGQDM